MPRNKHDISEQDRVQSLSNLQVFFDPEAFLDAIIDHGVELVHWRAMRCPGGMVSIDDMRHPNICHLGCSNGFIFSRAGSLKCLFSSNSDSPQVQETGVLDSSGVQVTLPTCYDDGKPVFVACFDRLYLAEERLVVPEWELVEYHITGRDRLRRAAVAVQDLIDSNGVAYKEGIDFEVRQGQIFWLTENRPGIDPATGKGRVYACRYLYRPYFYIKSIAHEVRVAQVDGPDGRVSARMPQAVTLQREFVFENESKDPEAPMPESWRQVKGPADGSFGPR